MKDIHPSAQQKPGERLHIQDTCLRGGAACPNTAGAESESTLNCVVHKCIEALLSCNHQNHLDCILRNLIPSHDLTVPFEETKTDEPSSVENFPVISYINVCVPNVDTSLFLCNLTSWARLRSLAQLMSEDGCCVFGVAHPRSCFKESSTLYVWNLHPCTTNQVEQQQERFIWFWIPKKYSREFQTLVISRLRLFSENMICKEHHEDNELPSFRVLKLVLENEDDVLMLSGRGKSHGLTSEPICKRLSSIYLFHNSSSSSNSNEELCMCRGNFDQHDSSDSSASKVHIIDMDLNQLKCELKDDEEKTIQECESKPVRAEVKNLSETISPRRCLKGKGKISVVCPKLQCRKQYVHRHKGKLLSHIKRFHIKDPEYNKLMAAFKELFPERNKTPKKACELCGKLIAGRGAQMRKHQGKSGCKIFNK